MRLLLCLSFLFLLACNNDKESAGTGEKIEGQGDSSNLKSTGTTPEDLTPVPGPVRELEATYNRIYEAAERGDSSVLSMADSVFQANPPQTEKAWYSLGVYFTKKGQRERALKSFDQAIATNYRFEDAYHDKGVLLTQMKQYKEARRIFNLALQISPEEGLYYQRLGEIDAAEGKKREAEENFARAKSLGYTP